MIELIPSILEADFGELSRKFSLVENLVDWVQIDIADGLLVKNTVDHDASLFAEMAKRKNLELHLMVKNPASYVEKFAQAGIKRFYAHVEGEGIEEFIEACLRSGVEVGLALDGPTPIDRLMPYFNDIDSILIMAIISGYAGQPFLEDCTIKIKKLRDKDPDMPICVDGGMTLENALKVVRVGANKINSNSYLFTSPDIAKTISEFKNLDTVDQIRR